MNSFLCPFILWPKTYYYVQNIIIHEGARSPGGVRSPIQSVLSLTLPIIFEIPLKYTNLKICIYITLIDFPSRKSTFPYKNHKITISSEHLLPAITKLPMDSTLVIKHMKLGYGVPINCIKRASGLNLYDFLPKNLIKIFCKNLVLCIRVHVEYFTLHIGQKKTSKKD